jgi:hypothetical protein
MIPLTVPEMMGCYCPRAVTAHDDVPAWRASIRADLEDVRLMDGLRAGAPGTAR